MKIARGIKADLNVTATPFLPAKQIGEILGASPGIGSDGAVELNVPRKEQMMLGGIPISSHSNVATEIVFQPLDGGSAAAAPDFGMIAREVNPVVAHMRK